MNLDRKYEKFSGEPNRRAEPRLHATMSRKGMIRLNATLYRAIGKPEAVYLYFNREQDHIVLEPTRSRMPSAFPIRESMGNYIIFAAPFCNHFGIHLDKTHKFIRPEPETDGKLVLDLKNIVCVARDPLRRTKKKQQQDE